jgi:hypothetical protein
MKTAGVYSGATADLDSVVISKKRRLPFSESLCRRACFTSRPFYPNSTSFTYRLYFCTGRVILRINNQISDNRDAVLATDFLYSLIIYTNLFAVIDHINDEKHETLLNMVPHELSAL